MKKTRLLNSLISEVISKMGHTDMLAIGDCGLPIPKDVLRIDLAIERGNPTFTEVLDVVLDELVVEKITLANEIKQNNPKILSEVSNKLNGVKCDFVSHEDFKNITKSCVAVIRTGEASPYANIILHSGVKFE